MQEAPESRAIEIATAIMLGIVSVVTALGALQAALWNQQAKVFSADAADARDQSIAIQVAAQLQQRSDMRAVLTAAFLAMDQDAAEAAGDETEVIRLESMIHTELGSITYLPEGSFDAWREGGFSDDGNPLDGPDYLVKQGSGQAAALTIASQQLSELNGRFSGRSGIFTQAALVHALSLFLFGVAGINRLRLARHVTLVAGGAVFVFGLFLMSTAY